MAKFTWLVPSLDKAAEKKALDGIEALANEIKSLSQTRCPVDTGTLRNSAVVVRDDAAKKVQVGYGGAASSYSIKQHEDMSLSHPVGQAKFLESAFTELKPKLEKYVKSKINL
jgi:hypothetical protein